MKTKFTRLAALSLVVAALVVSAACSTKDVVVGGLLSLQTAAITANQQIDPTTNQPLLSDADTMKVVRYTTQTMVTIQAERSGWKVAVQTGWQAFDSDLSSGVKTRFAAPLAIIGGAVGSL